MIIRTCDQRFSISRQFNFISKAISFICCFDVLPQLMPCIISPFQYPDITWMISSVITSKSSYSQYLSISRKIYIESKIMGFKFPNLFFSQEHLPIRIPYGKTQQSNDRKLDSRHLFFYQNTEILSNATNW